MFTYEQALVLAHSWGSVYFLALFVVACIYAYWPGNQSKFQKAASAPLEDDEIL